MSSASCPPPLSASLAAAASAVLPAATPRRACCGSPCCAPAGGSPIRRCTTGWTRGPPWRTPARGMHPRTTPRLRGFRVHPLRCRGSGLPLCFIVAPANAHDAPFARPLLTWVVHLSALRRAPRCRLLGTPSDPLAAHPPRCPGGDPVNPKRQKNRTCLPPTWTRDEPGKRCSTEHFFGHVFRFSGRQRPPVVGWTAVVQRVAFTSTATLVVALAAHHAARPDRIRSPKRVLAHLWEGDLMG